MWSSVVDGRQLHFRLVGINNQNFVMQDAETGTWWQQVTGRGILGPLKGRRLELVPHDEVAFAIWKADHPAGVVLAPDPAIEARDRGYARLGWERRMAKTPVVTELPEGSPFEPRTLVVGINVDGRSKAYPLDALRRARVILDDIGDTPVLLAIAEDDRSIRVFDRRIDGRPSEFAAAPAAARPVLVDLDTGSQWDFSGTAIRGPLTGRRLSRIPHLLEYWFDWQTHQPRTGVYKPWQPVPIRKDRMEIPEPPG